MQKRHFILKNKNEKEALSFIFVLPFFNQSAAVFLKIIPKTHLYLNLFIKNSKNNYKFDKFINNLKNNLKGSINSFIIKSTDNKDEFLKDIIIQLDGRIIDINI